MEHLLEQTLTNTSTAPSPSIQACPTLRAVRIDPRVSPRVAPHRKSDISERPTRAPAPGPPAALCRGQIRRNHRPLVEACPRTFIASQEKSDVVRKMQLPSSRPSRLRARSRVSREGAKTRNQGSGIQDCLSHRLAVPTPSPCE